MATPVWLIGPSPATSIVVRLSSQSVPGVPSIGLQRSRLGASGAVETPGAKFGAPV